MLRRLTARGVHARELRSSPPLAIATRPVKVLSKELPDDGSAAPKKRAPGTKKDPRLRFCGDIIKELRQEMQAGSDGDETALEYHDGDLGAVRCLGLIDQYGVTYDGRFLPCCVWGGEGLTVGNVFETPLTELWTRPDVQQHREKLFHNGCSVGCFNHSLYEFTTSTGESFRVT